jgi:hypothetical protein
MSVYRRPQISRQLLEGAIDAAEVGEGGAIRYSVVFSGMSVRGVCFIAMSRRSHSVSPVSRKEPCRINRSMSASGNRRTYARCREGPLWGWLLSANLSRRASGIGADLTREGKRRASAVTADSGPSANSRRAFSGIALYAAYASTNRG